VGITSTPVIDPSTNLMYVEAKSKLANGTFIHRLHALDLTTGNEQPGSPVAITGSVPGSGDGGITDVFNPLMELNRPGLLLVNGVVYLGYASHCDFTPFHGWVFAYDASTLSQKSVFNTTPNGGVGDYSGLGGGGLWASGSGLAADDMANIYLPTGNGVFDTTAPVVDFGDTILKMSLSTTQLVVTDYFTPYQQSSLYTGDEDLGSGGVVLIPDQQGTYPHLLVQSGKSGTIYLVDRDQMTTGNQHYCSGCTSDPQIAQELQGAIGGMFSAPGYWNGNLYFWGIQNALKQYTLSGGRISTSPVASSTPTLGYPGASPGISANGTGNAIVWAIDSTQYGPPHQTTAGPAVLHAFDATNVAIELYNTTMAANQRDSAGNAVKYAVPTVANGKVYFGTQTELDVYGPLP